MPCCWRWPGLRWRRPAAPAPRRPPPAGTPPAWLKPSAALQESLPPAVRSQLPTFVSGDKVSGQTDGVVTVEGNAELRRHDTVIRADRLEFDQRSSEAKAQGEVLVNRNGNRFEGPELQLNVDTNQGSFQRTQFFAAAKRRPGRRQPGRFSRCRSPERSRRALLHLPPHARREVDARLADPRLAGGSGQRQTGGRGGRWRTRIQRRAHPGSAPPQLSADRCAQEWLSAALDQPGQRQRA